jgi:hypothetical protein
MITAETAAERLYRLAVDFAEAFSKADRSCARADSATDEDRSVLTSIAETGRVIVARRREDLRAGLREALHGTVRAVSDDELPVSIWHQGRVEVRAITSDGARAVRVRYTPAQALAAGAALIACAAITDQRAGGTLADILAAFPPNPVSVDEPPTDDDSIGRDAIGEKRAGSVGEASDA